MPNCNPSISLQLFIKFHYFFHSPKMVKYSLQDIKKIPLCISSYSYNSLFLCGCRFTFLHSCFIIFCFIYKPILNNRTNFSSQNAAGPLSNLIKINSFIPPRTSKWVKKDAKTKTKFVFPSIGLLGIEGNKRYLLLTSVRVIWL